MIICLGPTPTMQRTMTFAMLTLNEVNRTSRVHEFASGKSGNVVRVLHTLGSPCISSGFLGGNRGESYRADLDRTGIAHDFVYIQPNTRLCTTVIDESAGTATELLEESQPLPAADYQSLLAKLKTLLERAKLLVLSGNLPPGASADFYARCVELAGANVRVIVDTVGAPLLETLQYKPFIIKPNQSEVARTLGIEINSDEQLRQAMKQLISRGAQWVVVTRGPAATLVTDGQTFWQVKVPSVQAISPIGSGDAFAAGLACGLFNDNPVPEASILGAACGSANAMTSDAGHVQRDTVELLRLQISLSKLS